jgi:hypothetical protein
MATRAMPDERTNQPSELATRICSSTHEQTANALQDRGMPHY